MMWRDRLAFILNRADNLVSAYFLWRRQLADPDTYKNGRPSLLLILVGLAGAAVLLVTDFFKQSEEPLRAMIWEFRVVAPYLSWRIYGQLLFIAIVVVCFALLGDMARLMLSGSLKSLKRGR